VQGQIFKFGMELYFVFYVTGELKNFNIVCNIQL